MNPFRVGNGIFRSVDVRSSGETLERDQPSKVAKSIASVGTFVSERDTLIRPTLSNIVSAMNEAKENERNVLLAVAGIQAGRVWPLEKKRITIGRDSDNDIVMRDDSVSRHHAEIVFSNDDTAVLIDLGSSNGTFVDGNRIMHKDLELGSLLVFGIDSVFKFSKIDQVDYEYQNHLYESNVRDPLTGAFNRRYLDLSFESEISYSERYGTPLSFLLVDIDHFKKVNDNFGHQAGDNVLKEVVQVIKKIVRTEDVLSRYGGEEFAVLAPNTDSEGIRRLAERIRLAIETCSVAFHYREGVEHRLTVSIGCSSADNKEACSVDNLINRADENLYKAKRSGRNRVR